MQIHKMRVTIPANRRLVVEVPAEVPAGPAELLVLVEPAAPTGRTEPLPASNGRLRALQTRFAHDPRPFSELSREERRTRVQAVRGAGRGLFSPSEDFAKRKKEEVDLEERRFAR